VERLNRLLGGWGWLGLLAAPPILGVIFFMMGSFVDATLNADIAWSLFTAFWLHVALAYVALIVLMTARLGPAFGRKRRTRQATERIDSLRSRFLEAKVSPDELRALTEQHMAFAQKATSGHEARFAGRVLTRYGAVATLGGAVTGFIAFIALIDGEPAIGFGLVLVAATAGLTGSYGLANGIPLTTAARHQIRAERDALLHAETDAIILARDGGPSATPAPSPTMRPYTGR
jgi:hypothetical protein